jgi:hypothetical protein
MAEVGQPAPRTTVPYSQPRGIVGLLSGRQGRRSDWHLGMGEDTPCGPRSDGWRREPVRRSPEAWSRAGTGALFPCRIQRGKEELADWWPERRCAAAWGQAVIPDAYAILLFFFPSKGREAAFPGGTTAFVLACRSVLGRERVMVESGAGR